MFYALIWLGVFFGVALWSAVMWMFHAAGAWALANTGALAGGSGALQAIRLPAWVEPWIPPELVGAITQTVQGLAPMLEWLLALAPSLAGGFAVAMWVVWAIGAVGLVVLGLIASALVGMLRRSRGSAGRPRVNPGVGMSS